MYPYERFNSWMCRRALNRRYPEATIMATYRVSYKHVHVLVHVQFLFAVQLHEWCQFMVGSYPLYRT